MNDKTKINIFEYTDYKLFLMDYYSFRKKNSRHFSYRYFAQKTNVSSSVLKDIISGRRNLTLAVMVKYAGAMNLSAREIKYFEVLVTFNNTKKNTEKNGCFTEMIRIRGRSGLKFIGENHYAFFSRWYHSAIRELITLSDFKEDYDWIAKRLTPTITTTQAKNSIDLMLEMGIINRDNRGNLIQKDAVISSEYEMASAALRNYHTQMAELAMRSIEKTPRELREISSLTLGLSDKCVSRIKERIRIFKEEILTMVIDDKSDSDTICQFNFQLFPLIKEEIKKEN